MIGEGAPLSVADAQGRLLADAVRRLGDLERGLSRRNAEVSYSPTWTGSTTNPVVGTDGSRVGHYQIIGNRCFFRMLMAFGSSGAGGAGGSGSYAFGLPTGFPPAASVEAFGQIGVGTLVLGTAQTRFLCSVNRNGTANTVALYVGAQTGAVGHNAPLAVDFGNEFRFKGDYEI